MGQRELEALDKELLDVWAADVVGLLELNNLEDLHFVNIQYFRTVEVIVRT